MKNFAKRISCAVLAGAMAVSSLTFSASALKEPTVHTDTVQSYSVNTALKKLLISAPKIKSLTNTTSGVYISWNSVKGAGKYRVYRRTSSSLWKTVGDTKSTKLTDKKALSGTKYYYAVCCLDSKGKIKSLKSQSKSITFIAAPKISSIVNTTAGPVIKWAKVKGASKYKVFYLSGKTWKALATTNSSSYTHKKAKSGTKYTYTVRCIDSNGKYIGSYNKTGKSNKFVKPKPESKQAVVEKYVKAINAAKKEKNMTVRYKNSMDVKILETDPNSMKSMMNRLVSQFFEPVDETYKFKNGKDKNGFTPNNILPPAGKKCTLTADGIKSVKSEKTSNGNIYTITLKSEEMSLDNMHAKIHDSCIGIGDVGELDEMIALDLERCDVEYPATVITATINSKGKLTKLGIKMPFTFDMGIEMETSTARIKAKITSNDIYTFKY